MCPFTRHKIKHDLINTFTGKKKRKKQTTFTTLHFQYSKLNIKECIDILQLSQFLFEYQNVPRKQENHIQN